MTDAVRVSSSLVPPIYTQANSGQPIELGQLPIRFEYRDAVVHGTAEVAMRFAASDRLDFVCTPADEFPSSVLRLMGDPSWNGKLTLTERGVVLDVICIEANWSPQRVVFTPKTSPATVTPPSNAISNVLVHLFNLPEFYGSDDYILDRDGPSGHMSKRCGRAVLSAQDWAITIAATDQTERLSKELQAQGGYALTHTGLIERANGSVFSAEQLDDLLSCLSSFLSFAFGRWTGTALPIGFNAEGDRIFEQWGLGKTADGPWNGASAWFDKHHGELLSQVFPGFVALWTNTLWRAPLSNALYWYLAACDRRIGIGVDSGLILAQNALELLAWTHCVLDKKMVSPSAFKPRGLSAADKMRLLMSSLGIPREVPVALSSIISKSGKKWTDGLEAVSEIRNSLAHPDSRREIPTDAYFEAWKLSLWYIDLVLLRMCGHYGEYANRLNNRRWTGQVETVPWAKDSV